LCEVLEVSIWHVQSMFLDLYFLLAFLICVLWFAFFDFCVQFSHVWIFQFTWSFQFLWIQTCVKLCCVQIVYMWNFFLVMTLIWHPLNFKFGLFFLSFVVLETPLTNTHPCFDLPSNNSFESLCEIVYTYLSSMENG
jgi:hypothetical protein